MDLQGSLFGIESLLENLKKPYKELIQLLCYHIEIGQGTHKLLKEVKSLQLITWEEMEAVAVVDV